MYHTIITSNTQSQKVLRVVDSINGTFMEVHVSYFHNIYSHKAPWKVISEYTLNFSEYTLNFPNFFSIK